MYTTQNVPKLTIFTAKSQKKFCGEGTAPSPDHDTAFGSFGASVVAPMALDLSASSTLLAAYTHFYFQY